MEVRMQFMLGSVKNDYQRWLKSYMRHLKYRDLSLNTLEVYGRILFKLDTFIQEQKRIKQMDEINQHFFLDFIETCEERSKKGSFSKKTKQLYLCVLKSFFLYISDNNDSFYTYENEFKIGFKGVKQSKKVKYLSDDEVEMLLAYLEDMRLNKGGYYDFIYSLGVKLMLFGGLRISEVLPLRLKDITLCDLRDEDGNRDIYEIHLQKTKSGDSQTALIKVEDICEELAYFRAIYPPDVSLFQSTKGTAIHRSNFYIGIKAIMAKVGIDKKGLHIFRHTCAMQLYRKSKDILVTKEKLRHADIKTTMIYAYAEKGDVARAMR